MKIKCSICKYTFEQSNVKFVKCPKDDRKRKMWSDACGENLSQHSKICMYHFRNCDYVELHGEGKRARLMPNAIPFREPVKDFEEFLLYANFLSGKKIIKFLTTSKMSGVGINF